jgi:hypothetical protein
MDTLATTARQRAVMATIADLIVAAAAGKRLRVAVGCTHPDETAFVEHLTRAPYAADGSATAWHPNPIRSRPTGTPPPAALPSR